MRHLGVHVGNFYLVEKEGGEAFTDEDEEILVLFASQAATAIANARTYRAEQRARRAGPRTGRGAHPGGRRRPGDAAPSPRHVGGGGLRPAGHRRPPGSWRASSGPKSPNWSCST